MSNISTICVRGLPDSCTRREFRNMVAMMPGYCDSSLSGGESRTHATGFVKFDDPESASDAMQKLAAHSFDLAEPERMMKVEMAKRDLEQRAYVPPRPAPRPQVLQQLQQHHQQQQQQPYLMDLYGSSQMYGDIRQTGSSYAAPMQLAYQQQQQHQGGYGGMSEASSRKRSRYDQAPALGLGDTLCIRKIPEGTSEQRLRSLVSELHGFQGMNYVRAGGQPVVFALFNDADCAQDAMRSLQSVELDGHAVSVEVARRSLQL